MAHRVQSLIESIHADDSCPRLQVDLTSDGIVCPDFVCEKWGEELVIDLDPSYPLDLEFTATGIDVDLSFGGYVTRCTFPYAAIYMVADRATGRGILIDENMPESVRRRRQPQPSRAPDVEAEKRAAMEKLAREARSKRGPGSSRRRKRRKPGDKVEETSVEQVETAASDTPEEEAPPKIGLAVVRPVEPETETEPKAETETEPPAALESPTPLTVPDEPEPAPQPQPATGSEARNLDAMDPPDEPPRPSDQEALRRRSVFKVIDGGK